MKVLVCSLMLRLSEVWFILYASVDMSLYFLYKILRSDLRYWVNLPDALSWVVSIIIRLVIKTIADFTLLLQFRHPFELGGIYWAWNILANQLFCFASVYLYNRFAVDSGSSGVDALNKSTSIANIAIHCNSTGNNTNTAGCVATELPLWELVVGLFAMSMLSFFIFSRLINKGYLWTFYDMRTGKQMAVDTFKEVESANSKFEIFGHHRSFYDTIEKELKTWLKENWERWQEEKPDWFTAAAIESVPVDMLPLSAMNSLGGVKGRRGSLDKMAKGEKAEKVRRASAAQVVPSG